MYLRLNNAGSGPAIDLQKMPILQKMYVNKQNCRIWGRENPHTHTLKSRDTHPQRVTIWCGFLSTGPFFFENEQGRIWLCIRLNNAVGGPASDFQKLPILAKKKRLFR